MQKYHQKIDSIKVGDIITLPDGFQYIILAINGDYIHMRKATYGDIVTYSYSEPGVGGSPDINKEKGV